VSDTSPADASARDLIWLAASALLNEFPHIVWRVVRSAIWSREPSTPRASRKPPRRSKLTPTVKASSTEKGEPISASSRAHRRGPWRGDRAIDERACSRPFPCCPSSAGTAAPYVAALKGWVVRREDALPAALNRAKTAPWWSGRAVMRRERTDQGEPSGRLPPRRRRDAPDDDRQFRPTAHAHGQVSSTIRACRWPTCGQLARYRAYAGGPAAERRWHSLGIDSSISERRLARSAH
jgi:hypothetical protein